MPKAKSATKLRRTKAEVRAAHLQSLIDGTAQHLTHNTRNSAGTNREKYAGVALMLACSLFRDQRDEEAKPTPNNT